MSMKQQCLKTELVLQGEKWKYVTPCRIEMDPKSATLQAQCCNVTRYIFQYLYL